jgi:hypothetical protein
MGQEVIEDALFKISTANIKKIDSTFSPGKS